MSVFAYDDEEKRDLLLSYRRVFNTPDGREVLLDILGDLKFFDTIQSVNEATLHNAAKMILFKLGAWQDHNMAATIGALLSFPYIPPMTMGEKE